MLKIGALVWKTKCAFHFTFKSLYDCISKAYTRTPLRFSVGSNERREREREMQHRKPAVGNGRPSGTDGSDFSYRMVVDSSKLPFDLFFLPVHLISICFVVFFSQLVFNGFVILIITGVNCRVYKGSQRKVSSLCPHLHSGTSLSLSTYVSRSHVNTGV